MDIAALTQWTSALQALTPPQQRELTQQLASIPPITIAGKQASVLLAPLPLTPPAAAQLAQAVYTLQDALVAIESHPSFLPGQVVYDRLYQSLSAQGKYLVDHAPPVSPRTMRRRFRRIDGFLPLAPHSPGPQFIEVNQSAPLAISFYERTRQALAMTAAYVPAVQAAPAPGAPSTPGVAGSPSLYAALADWFMDAAPDKLSLTVAVSMERGYPAKFVDLPAATAGIAQAARERGVELRFVLAQPPEFRYQSGRMTVRGHSFDVLWRNTVYLANYDVDIADYQAIRYSPAVVQQNDLRAWLLRSKELFALAWDDTVQATLAAMGVDVPALRRIMPPTYSLAAAQQLDWQRTHRRQDYIAKRCDDGFGQGLVFGHQCTDRQWQALLAGSRGQDWVVQQLVPVAPVEVPLYTPGHGGYARLQPLHRGWYAGRGARPGNAGSPANGWPAGYEYRGGGGYRCLYRRGVDALAGIGQRAGHKLLYQGGGGWDDGCIECLLLCLAEGLEHKGRIAHTPP